MENIEESNTAETEVQNPKASLNPQQELFCQYYARHVDCYGNATRSYLLAYDYEDDPNNRRVAEACGSRLLSDARVQQRVAQLRAEFLTDEFVDAELADVIRQNEDRGPKVQAIREYNKLRQRIVDKQEIKHTGSISLTELFEKSQEKTPQE